MVPPKANILLVDDQPGNLLVLEAVLQGLGQNLVKANSAAQALKCLLNDEFALILMDAQMPVMDGFEAATLIRQREKTRFTPIIFITAYEHTGSQVFKGYSIGAVDFLFKPVIPEILRSKVSVFVDLHQKTEEVKRQAELLRQQERREHARELIEQQRRYEAERMHDKLREAREIQQRLFPPAPPKRPGFDIFGASFPADIMGGDYFDYFPIQEETLGIAIGDVCGHGFGPSLLMAATRAYLRALMLTEATVGDILTLANRALAADVSEGRFVTLLLARLEPHTGSFLYANAGHPSGYVLAPSGEVKSELESTGCPLGLSTEIAFADAPATALCPGDLVLLLTDGVVEASRPDETFFGIDRALEIVRAHQEQSAQDIVSALYAGVHDFTGQQGHLDDITAIVIKKDPNPGRGKPR
jgi:serine phosphatase RsbU (regulator of sigma subunit)